MAKGQSLAWKELRVGILVVASFVLLFVAIFFIGGENGFFTPKYNITAYFQSANGLHAGAVVLLDGVTIGNVSAVRLIPQAPPEKAVEATLRLDRRYHDMIHTDATVSIGTVGLLGDQEIELTRGTAAMPLVADGGSIQGAPPSDIKQIISGTNDVVANLNKLTDQVSDVLSKVEKGQGTMGLLLNDRGVYDKLNATVMEANNLVKDAHSGKGTFGQLVSNDELYRNLMAKMDKVDITLDKFDSIVAKIDHGDGTAAKLINDPSLFNKANQIIAKVEPIVDRINNGEGSLGKFSKDEALYNNLNSVVNRADKLVTAVENGEGTLGKLAKDPTMYNSLTQTSSEIQKLLYDFRQNPKKYLTINFRLF